MSKNTARTTLNSIKEAIVVEGKTDTNHLKKLFNCRTIETNGSALNKKTLNLIKKAATTSGIILFLDPDYMGEQIRRKIIAFLKGVKYKEAFVCQRHWDTFKKGVNEANDEVIIKAILKATKPSNNLKESISWDEYLVLPLNDKKSRQALCYKLEMSYCNHKQLFKRLNILHISDKEVRKLLKNEK